MSFIAPLLATLAVAPTFQDPAAAPAAPTAYEPPYEVPDGEVLDFDVAVDIPVLGESGLGKFQLSSGTEEGAPTTDGSAPRRKLRWIRAIATGRVLNYELEHSIDARVLAQDWPRVIYRDTQRGSENRKRELMYGIRDGTPMSWFREDRHCAKCEDSAHFVESGLPFAEPQHCKKCKRSAHRKWKRGEFHDAPKDAVTMLGAIYRARDMVRSGDDELELTLLDKEQWWRVKLTRAESRVIETPAGRFRCRAIKLDPTRGEGEREGDDERFEGLFGIHGTLSIWLEESTGVPVRIEGMVPAGLLEVSASLTLRAFEGTPEGFAPLKE